MPHRNGLEIAKDLLELKNPPVVVFVTAFDDHAVEAFELRALDYILKPFSADRIKKTCDRVRDTLSDEGKLEETLSSLRELVHSEQSKKILGHRANSRERIVIDSKDVLYFEMKLAGLTASLKNGGELLVSGTLKSLLSALNENYFQRTHKSFVVNLNEVEKVVPIFYGNCDLVMKGKTELKVPLSRTYAKDLKQYLKW